MAVPATINDISQTPSSNAPAGSESVFPLLDDYLRTGFSFIAVLRDTKLASSSVSSFVLPVLASSDGAAFRTAIGAADASAVALKGANTDITSLGALAAVPTVVTNAITAGVSKAPTVQGAFKNLQASASGTSASVAVSADELVLEDASNNYITLRALSLTINSAGTGASGLDTGTLAASTWYSVWVIWNGATASGLLSLSTTAPTMPSGYTHKARVGWIRADSTANKFPLSFKQFGRRSRYVVTAGSNMTGYPTLVSGVLGSVTTPTWVAVSVAGFVPPTACKIEAQSGNSPTSFQFMAAPNASFGAYSSLTNPPPLSVAGSASWGYSCGYDLMLETANIYYASAGGAPPLVCSGWEDNL